MDSVLEIWWVFPATIVFSTIAIASGISGARIPLISIPK